MTWAQRLQRGCEIDIRRCARLPALRERLWRGLRDLAEVRENGADESRVPGILNTSFEGVSGADPMPELQDAAVSSGSACASGHDRPSHVLRAIGCDDERADSAIRSSTGRFTTEEEIDRALASIERVLEALHSGAGASRSAPARE